MSCRTVTTASASTTGCCRAKTRGCCLRPYFVFRRVDAPLVAEEAPIRLSLGGGVHEVELPDASLKLAIAVRPDGGADFVERSRTSATALYREERDRGYEHVETSVSPGHFAVDLRRDGPVTFVATTEPWPAELDGATVLDAERTRTDQLIGMAADAREPFARRLVLAADQFLVLPESRSEDAVAAHAAGDGGAHGHRRLSLVQATGDATR